MEKDNVNHPSHYNRDGAMECLEEMELIYGTTALMNFCLLNAHKYRYRAADKNGAEDIKKSDFYMKKYKELKEKVESSNKLSAGYFTLNPNNNSIALCSDKSKLTIGD